MQERNAVKIIIINGYQKFSLQFDTFAHPSEIVEKTTKSIYKNIYSDSIYMYISIYLGFVC